MKLSDLLYRKLIASIITVNIFSLVVSIIFVLGYDTYGSLDSGIIGISLITLFYITPFVLLYGVPVSILIEYTSLKFLPASNTLFIGMHSIFGMASYFIFWDWAGVIYGMILAALFACADRLLSSYRMTKKLIIASIVIPIGLYAFGIILIAGIE